MAQVAANYLNCVHTFTSEQELIDFESGLINNQDFHKLLYILNANDHPEQNQSINANPQSDIATTSDKTATESDSESNSEDDSEDDSEVFIEDIIEDIIEDDGENDGNTAKALDSISKKKNINEWTTDKDREPVGSEPLLLSHAYCGNEESDECNQVDRRQWLAIDMRKLRINDGALNDIWSEFGNKTARQLHNMPIAQDDWKKAIQSMTDEKMLEIFTNYDLPRNVFWLVWGQYVGIKFPRIMELRGSVVAGNFLCAQYYRTELLLNKEEYIGPQASETERLGPVLNQACPLCSRYDKEDSIQCDNCRRFYHREHELVKFSRPPGDDRESRRLWVCPLCMEPCVGECPMRLSPRTLDSRRESARGEKEALNRVYELREKNAPVL